MGKHIHKLQQLLEQGYWTDEDKKWLLDYLEQNNSTELQQFMQQYFNRNIDSNEQPQDEKAVLLLKLIHNRIKATPVKSLKIYSWFRISAAAAVLFVLIGTGVTYLLVKNNNSETVAENISTPAVNIPPGGNKAILTLADGGHVILDSAANGMISQQEGAQVIKSGDGQLEYLADKSKTEKIVYNSVSTPVGGTYQLTLSDGTKVWLNAASSIRFPAIFKGKERLVYITGEVYFEVNPQFPQSSAKKKIKAIPFLVDVAGKGVVEVIGTHFNVNSYANEPAVKTTLIEGNISFRMGSVTDKADQKSVILTSGQQAELAPDGALQVNNNVDTEKVLAWKKGYFQFSSSSLDEVMKQIARWYDVEVVFEGNSGNRRFGGKIQRDLNLAETLKILEKNNVRFRIEGRKVFVRS